MTVTKEMIKMKMKIMMKINNLQRHNQQKNNNLQNNKMMTMMKMKIAKMTSHHQELEGKTKIQTENKDTN